ncbi:hypothetical protein [Microbacterium sp. JZ31]|uniref:hypothetical protein n=1 Tax=Microbacterium sp. JZ31 TaxID=1906274 RepID=UPI001EE420B1|nr:hypothetical protein [Microbacterium sp. JZ31]
MSTPIDRDDAGRNRGDREHDTGVTTGHSSPDLDAGRGSDEPTVVHEATPVDDRTTSGALRADQRGDGGDPQVVQRDFADRDYVAGGPTGRGQIVGDHGDQGVDPDRDRKAAEDRDGDRDRNRDLDRDRDRDRNRDLDRDRDSDRAMDRDRDATVAAPVAGAVSPEAARNARHEVVEREKQEFGGMKFGSAFFGWLSAMGMTVLLTALVAGAGAALGLGAQVDPEQAAQENAGTIGIAGAIAVLVILLIAYYCGGYVAGRMARFSGAKQGIAVWLWAIVIAIVVAIIAAIGGAQWNILANINTFPRLPFSEGQLTTAGIITAVGALLVSLLGAVLGGLAGMRYHRKVDRAGFGR